MTEKKMDKLGLTDDQLRQIFDLEKSLASKLRLAGKEERRKLYGPVYKEYFSALSFHPQLLVRDDKNKLHLKIGFQLKIIKKFITPDDVFLEIGSGDGHLCYEVAKIAKKVYAYEVSDVISRGLKIPDNYQQILSDSFVFPVDDNSVDIAYSNSLIEHLHEDDAFDQLISIHVFLKKGGKYICVTPNKYTGPHDISRFFDEPYSCFHLKEYSCVDLRKLFLDAGFRKGRFYIFIKGRYYKSPFFVMRSLDYFLKNLKEKNKNRLIHSKIGSILLDYVFVGIK
jgi:SAM-dependent methyltransferase